MERQPKAILLGVMLLAAAAALALLVDAQAWKGRQAENTRVFQRATGGLGMGAIATPIWQFVNYDARILSVDDSITWPMPGAYSFGPDRTGTVSYFEETPLDEWNIVSGEAQKPPVRGGR